MEGESGEQEEVN